MVLCREDIKANRFFEMIFHDDCDKAELEEIVYFGKSRQSGEQSTGAKTLCGLSLHKCQERPASWAE